jgi:hypothetical protein
VPTRLLDGSKTEEALMTMLDMGYARRCFFGYVRAADHRYQLSSGTAVRELAEKMFDDRTNKSNEAAVEHLADHFYRMADIINANKKLMITRDTCIMLNEYEVLCKDRASKLPEHREMQKRELSERSFKVLKLAGAYAFADDSASVTDAHIEAAIRLAEDSGEAFTQLLSRDKPWVKLAKYIGSVGQDVLQGRPWLQAGSDGSGHRMGLQEQHHHQEDVR